MLSEETRRRQLTNYSGQLTVKEAAKPQRPPKAETGLFYQRVNVTVQSAA